MVQAFKTIERAPNAHVVLLSNPYTPDAVHIISKRFPQMNTPDCIKAIMLTEPEGMYEENFRQLGIPEQVEEVCRQIDISLQLQKRLTDYWQTYAAELVLLPREHIYDCLSLVVFETTDTTNIAQRYTPKQRLYFRLAIINVIESTKKDDAHVSAIKGLPKKRALRRWLVHVSFSVIYLLFFFSLTYGFYEQYRFHASKSEVLGNETQNERKSLPRRLKISSINVDAAVENVGVTSEGSMEVPKNTDHVGWFDLGSRPGEEGSAVIAGHFDGENNTTGVFTHLNMLKKGDTLSIEDDKGTSIVFIVREIRTYDPGYAEDVFSQREGVHLNLITCDGVWDSTKKSYSKRLVVFTDLLMK